MKKITLIFTLLLIGMLGSYAQCITTAGPLGPYNMTNNGLAETVSLYTYTPEYIVVNNLSVGSDYIFTIVQTSNNTPKYITVTDTSNGVIAHGMSPLTVQAVTASSVRIHATNSDACTGATNSAHVVTAQVVLTCPVPLQVSYSGVTTTDATFNWQAGGTETAWEVLLIPDTDPAPTASTSGDPVNGTPTYSVTNLNASSPYKFYVRANCGSEFSPWTVNLKFNTLCEAFDSFTENFESTATGTVMPTCWSKKIESSSTTSYVYVSATGGNTAVKSLIMGNSGGTNAKIYAVTPQLTALPLQTHRLKFFSKGSTTATLEVGTMTDPNDAATFTSIATFPLTTAYAAHTVNFDAPTSATFIAFRGNFTLTYYTITIDDVVWEELPTCPDTFGLTVGTVTSSNANVSWTAGTATAWQYALGSSSDTDPDAVGQIGVSTASAGIPVSAATTYKVWVRANCNGNYGAWSSPVTFTSLCEATPAPTQLQDFNSTTGTALPECWSSALVSDTTGWTTIVPSTAYDITTSHSPTRILFKNYTTSSALAFTQPMDFSGVNAPTRVSLYLHRHASAHAQDEYKVFVNTTASLTGATQILQQLSKTTLSSNVVAATGWYKQTADIPTSFNGLPQVFVIIQGITTAGSSSYALGIDDFQVEYSPSCVEPTLVNVSNITNNTATFSWTAPASAPAQGYSYAYSTTNSSPEDAEFMGTTLAGVTTVQLNNLDPNTTFYFWIKSVCSGSDVSVWTAVKSFKTACDGFDNFTEGFETTATVTVMPDCWNRKIESSSTTSYVYVSASGGNTDVKSLVMGNSGGANAKIYAITPALNALTLQSHRIKFFAKGSTTATLEVGTMTDPGDSATFTSIGTFPLTTTHVAHTVNFDAPTTAKYIAFRGNFTSTYYTINIDDVVWEELPSCLEPSGIQFSDTATTSTTVNWNASSTAPALGYEYAYSTTSSSPTSAEFVGTVNAGVLTTTLNDLSPSTTYYFWIRSICNANDSSEWTAVASFSTACGSTDSLAEGFESTATGTVMPNCWSKKIVSTSTSSYAYVSASEAQAGLKALRLGNSDGTNAVIYAVTPPLTNLGAQTHSLQFYALGSPGVVFKVGTMGDPNNESTFTEIATFTLTYTHQLFTVNFTEPTTANHIAFRAQYNTTYNYVSIDSIQWQQSLSAPSFDQANFKAYPNPVRDVLNLSYVNNITDVAVFNIVGQQVMTKKINNSNAQLDMSALSAGTYIVRVTADNQTKSIKIIKE